MNIVIIVGCNDYDNTDDDFFRKHYLIYQIDYFNEFNNNVT